MLLVRPADALASSKNGKKVRTLRPLESSMLANCSQGEYNPHMDEISLHGLTFFGRHGVNAEETSLGQRFGVDVTFWMDLAKAATSDSIEDTVSYSAVFKLIRSEVEGEPSKLLEHLAGRLVDRIAAQDTRIRKIRVTVTKLNPPLKGSVTGNVSVTLVRETK